MIWDLSMDDFGNFCGSGKYPVLEKINFILNNGLTQTTERAIDGITTKTLNDSSDGGNRNESVQDLGTADATTDAATSTGAVEDDGLEGRHVPFYMNPWGVAIIFMALVCMGIGVAVGVVIPRLNRSKK